MRKQTKLVAVLSAAALLAIGASMTSFAAAPHWDMEDNEWVYLDRNGDRVTDEWKKSNGQWYYLDENGYMARDMIIEDDEEKYYVDENGARVTNAWVSMDNDDLLDDDNEPESIDTVWMYFDGNGKALGAGKTNGEIKRLNYGDGQSGYFIFNDEGYMLSGWKRWNKSDGLGNGKLYYLGSQNEGWAAASTWKYLEVDKDWEVFDNVDDDDDGEERWFYFNSDGKACQSETKSIGGKTYAFDQFGRMLDLWTTGSGATLSNVNASSSAADAVFYREDNGGREKGWVEVYPNSDYDDYDDDPYWFYLNSKGEPWKAEYKANETIGEATRIDDDDENDASKTKYNKNVAIKSIKDEDYLFNNKGVMLKGLYELDGNVKKGSTTLGADAGLYYFEDADGSVEGQMVTNRKVKIEVDDEDETYYFSKQGKAFINTVISSSIYGKDGKLYDDDGDGNTYEMVQLGEIVGTKDPYLYEKKGDKRVKVEGLTATDYVMVNGNGKIKKSGTVTDGNDAKCKVDGYKVIEVDGVSLNSSSSTDSE